MLKRLLIAAIYGYRRWISPLFLPSCRFTPSCSNYAIAAIEQYGPLRGSILAVRRILRCHPFAPGGYDPVPARLDRGAFFTRSTISTAAWSGRSDALTDRPDSPGDRPKMAPPTDDP
jgi:putative membrane protein insertion efficiency factor